MRLKKSSLCLSVICVFFLAGCKGVDTPNNDAENIGIIATWIEEQIPEVISENINLPLTHPTLGGVITWLSYDEDVINAFGEIFPPDGTQEAMIQYTLQLGEYTRTNILTILIVGKTIEDVRDVFINQFAAVIARDYNIKTYFYESFNVTWFSSNEEVFTNEGTYLAPFIDTAITISYTIFSPQSSTGVSFEKNITVTSMPVIERKAYILHWLDNHFNNITILEETEVLPSTIDIDNVTLSWLDGDYHPITTLADVTTYIIPKVGVELIILVTALDQSFEMTVRYQTIESNMLASMRQIPSIDLVKEMKVGWNLGNTLDAPSETVWGNPITTKAMIDAVKEAGFNVVRIPVTWEGHFSATNDYIIDEDWINRVQTVINYAIDQQTFVILNMHHERWNTTTYQNKDNASLIMEQLWTQIGTRFANYNEFLIFEGMNEPRIYEAIPSIQWRGNAEAFDVINHLNQVFVNTVRSLGGNNLYRHLLITPNGAGTSEDILSNLVVPNDAYVIVSVHAYTPYDFAHDRTDVVIWSKDNPNQTNPIDAIFDHLYNLFIQHDIAVIMGEFAARDKNNLDSRIEWLEYYLSRATEINIPCIWWDSGQIKTVENMTVSIFNRRTRTWIFPEIVDTLMAFSR